MIREITKALSFVDRPFFLLPGLLLAHEHPSSGEFKKEVNLVQVPVVVRDKAGHAVRDLDVEDISVYDNGKLQSITRFRYLKGDGGQDVGRSGSEIVLQQTSTLMGRAEDSHLLIVIPQLQFASRPTWRSTDWRRHFNRICLGA